MEAARSYRQSQVESADKLELVRLTYTALTQALTAAREAILAGDLQREAEQTARAMEALVELASSLDMERGGEIAHNLAALYAYLMNRLANGLCSASTEAVDETLQIVGVLRSAWDELAERRRSEALAHAHAQAAQLAGAVSA